ncbi:MAG TPA: ATPase, T2SS/T4P/T4SS family [Phycisphaerae bacterium]|nr:ATPase, T2SS/T4P/T4SS family [Phycisphaerae bacterium]
MAPIIAAAGEVGGYISLAKIVTMVVFFAPWLYAAPWANKDSRRLMLGQTRWGIIILTGATLGWVLWLTVPIFMVGMGLYLILAGGSMTAYVLFRNSRVPDSAKVLTAEHISSLMSFIGRRRQAETPIVTRVKLYGSHGRIVLAPDPRAATHEEIGSYNLTQAMLHELAWCRASEADLSPAGRQARVRLVVDGVAVDQPAWSLGESEGVIQFLKLHGGMSVEDRRRPQRGRIAVDLSGKRLDIVLTSAGSTRGQRMQFRVEQESARTHLDELGMAGDQLATVRELARAAKGLIIVSGRSGSGVTSTLYSLMREHDAFTKALMTLEREPEVDLENITQFPYKEEAETPGALASVLRRDPDVVMVDACPDADTASYIIQAAGSRKIFLGMHAGDSFVALAKWIKVSDRPAEALANLTLVIYQVLLRKLCPSCKEAYRPDPHLLSKANLQSANIDKFYRKPTRPLTDEKGNPIICQACQGTGYVGRTGAFETLVLTDAVKQLVLAGAPVSEIKAECRKSKMLYLQERALERVISGDTGIQEVIRITQEARK